MRKLIQFEMTKIIRSNFFRIMLLALCTFIVAYYAFVYMNTTRVEEVITEEEEHVQMSNEQLQLLRESLDSSDGNEKKRIENELEFSENWSKEVEITLKAYQEKDWTTLLNQAIAKDEDFMDGRTREDYFASSWPTLFTTETRVEEYRWLVEREIAPVLRLFIYSYMTIYDVHFPIIGGSEEEHKEMTVKLSTKYSSTGIYYLNHLSLLIFGVLGAMFFLFLFGDIVTKEELGRNGPINLLQTQPINRDKVLLSKFLTVLISSILILVGISIISLVIGTIFDSFGFWNYPVLIYGEEYSFAFMNMSTFIIKSALLFFMILLFSYSILFLYSILTKRASTAIGLTIVTLILGIRLSEESILSSLAPYVPFNYFSVTQVLTMELAGSLKNFDFTYTNGLIALGIASFIVLVVTYIVSVIQYRFGG